MINRLGIEKLLEGREPGVFSLSMLTPSDVAQPTTVRKPAVWLGRLQASSASLPSITKMSPTLVS